MPSDFCSVCGALLRDGVCPQGHPQRAVRRRAQGRARRRRRGPIILVILVALLGAGAYLGLVSYPEGATADLMRPSSAEFAPALQTYQATTQALPPGATDPSVLITQAQAVLDSAAAARAELATASSRLEFREPTELPVVSSRPPLEQAIRLRDQMMSFYTRALENVADLESVAGYLTQLAGVLPQLDDLETTLGQRDVNAAVAAATPVADQLVADLQALGPPDDLGALHASLVAIAQRVRADLGEMAEASQSGATQVASALLQDIRGDVGTFRDTVGTAPDLARQAGLGARLREVNALAGRITVGLTSLREVYGVTGLTLPS